MKKLKKLKVFICAAIIISVSMSPEPIEAQQVYVNDVRSSYTQPYSGYVDEAYRISNPDNRIKEQCRVKNPYNMFLDTGIAEKAQEYINKGYYVGNMRYLLEYGYYKIVADDYGNAFNYGFIAEKPGEDYVVVCKCTPSEYRKFLNYYDYKAEIISDQLFILNGSEIVSWGSYNSSKQILDMEVEWH